MENPEIKKDIGKIEKLKSLLKNNWKPIVGVVGAAGLKVTLAVLETRRADRKTEAYINALETRTEAQIIALGLNLPNYEFTNPQEDDES